MRKDSIAIGGLTLLITAAIVGGAWYVAIKSADVPEGPPEPTLTTLLPSDQPAAGNVTQPSDVSAETSRIRTDQIIECNDPEIGKFYTNAVSCDTADVHNRLSIAEPLNSTPKPQPNSGDGYQTPAQQAASARKQTKPAKPNLRLAAKSPPSGLNPACSFAVGKALEIERALSAKNEPADSIWREDYCRWRCDAVQKQCKVADSYFYYRYQELCPDEYWNGC